jgi:hypothetical protein
VCVCVGRLGLSTERNIAYGEAVFEVRHACFDAFQDVQDKLYELHQLMIDAGLSVAVLAGEPAGSSHIRLLNMDKMFGRSLLKWIRDIGCESLHICLALHAFISPRFTTLLPLT